MTTDSSVRQHLISKVEEERDYVLSELQKRVEKAHRYGDSEFEIRIKNDIETLKKVYSHRLQTLKASDN